MDYDLGYFDHETCRLEPIENPFGPKVLPMPRNKPLPMWSEWTPAIRLGHQDSNLGMAESNLLFHTSIGTTLSNGSIFRPGRWVTTETDPCRPNRSSRLLDIAGLGSPCQSVCGGPSSSLSLAVSIAMRLSASVRVRLGLNASSS
jgi:hypothetical protein